MKMKRLKREKVHCGIVRRNALRNEQAKGLPGELLLLLYVMLGWRLSDAVLSLDKLNERETNLNTLLLHSGAASLHRRHALPGHYCYPTTHVRQQKQQGSLSLAIR